MNIHVKDIEQRIDYEKSRAEPPREFPALEEIPGGRYTRQDFYDLEIEHVFRKSWVVAGMRDECAEPGDYKLFDKLGAPIILVRGRDAKIRAFYNTCRHRGAPVVRDEAGHTTLLRCQYHSWAYGLDGKLIAVPDARDFPGLNKCDRGLIEVRCEEWNNLIFINLDTDAPPLVEFLGALDEELAFLRPLKLRTVHRQNYIVGCNWKAAADAFNEVYHVNTIHSSTGGKVFDTQASVNSLFAGGHARMVTRKTDGGQVAYARAAGEWITEIPDFYRENVVAYSVFPNASILIEPTGMTMQFLWPRGPDGVEIEAVYLGADWGEEERPRFWKNYLPIMDMVLREDIENLEPIQASMESGAFTGVLINYQERRISWFHEQIARAIGNERIPADLRMEQDLSPFVEGPISF